MLQNAIRNLKNQEGEGEGGFTLIELLVVILIIGILAAIALPTFLGQSDKAKDSSAKSDVRNAVTQMESCLVNDTYAACSDKTTDPGTTVFQSGATLEAPASGTAGPANYVLVKQSSSSDTTNFKIAKTSAGTFARACDKPGKGGCPKAVAPATTGAW